MSSISEYNCPLQGVILHIRVSREGGGDILTLLIVSYFYTTISN